MTRNKAEGIVREGAMKRLIYLDRVRGRRRKKFGLARKVLKDRCRRNARRRCDLAQ